uniref:Integrase catalytic domain-containing protein n=1 Tax=Tanacetum cinerariifolium TaxID=118510 RepID=A0A6L2J9K4_TANCI|nr:hypothetical protein [Tanacetum cinerariifolium]
MANDGEDHALVADEEALTKFALMANTSTKSKVFDNSLCSKDCKKNNDSLNSKIIDLTDKLFDAKNMIYHYKLALAQVESRLVEYKEREVKYIKKIKTLKFYNESNKECIKTLKKKLETLKQEKEGVDGKLAGLLTASKNLNNLIESQRLDKNKEGLGYTAVPPPPVQLYLSPKKELSWTGLPECADDTVTDYSKPSPTVESTSEEDQNRNPSVSENVASPITPKPFIKFVKPKDSQSESKTDKLETPKKPPVKYVEQYRKPNKKPNVRGNQRNWNNLKSHQLGPEFVMKKKACFNCGDFNHLAYDCRKRGSSQNKIDDKGYWDSGEDMCLLVKEDARLQERGQSKLDETSGILKKFITEIENLKDLKVKISGVTIGGFRNKEMNDFCLQKRIKREFSNARTPQQNGVTESRNRTLIEAARTVLADAKLPVTFWAEAVYTACYVQNRVLVNKSHNKTPYELFNGRSPAIGFLKPFGCHVIILNTLDHLGKFEEKGMKVTLLDTQCTKDTTSQEVKKDVCSLRYIALPNWAHDALLEFSLSKPQDHYSTEVLEGSGNTNPTASRPNPLVDHMETLTVETSIPTVSSPIPTAYSTDSLSDARLISKRVTNQEETPSLDNILSLTNRFEDILRSTTNSNESNGEEADISNMETTILASPTPTLRIHKDHPKKPKKISDTLQDPSWVEAMQEELLQFKIQKEDGIDYDEVFAPVARIEAIRLFLTYASFMGFTVYQMDVKSAFLYVTIDEEAPRAWYGTLSKYLLKNGFQRVLQKEDGIFLSQDKYVGDILKKFRYSNVRSLNTPMDKENPWGKDGTGKDVDLHLYRSMIGSLMYLTASRPDIMFVIYAYARHQVTPKECHLHAVKRIF